MERPLERNEQPKLNLLDDPAAAMKAIGKIEGPGWMEHQDRIGRQIVEDGLIEPAAIEEVAHDTIIGALRHLNDLGQIDLEMDPHKIYTIYGNGGINRWYVYSDGSLKFSASHSQPGHSEAAQELGFDILP